MYLSSKTACLTWGLVLFIVLPFLGLTAGYVAIKKPSFGGSGSSEASSSGGGVGIGSGGSGGSGDSGKAMEAVGTQVTYKSSATDVQLNKGCACGK